VFLSLIRKLLRISLYNYSKWNTIQQTILNNNLTMIQKQQMMMHQQAMQNQMVTTKAMNDMMMHQQIMNQMNMF